MTFSQYAEILKFHGLFFDERIQRAKEIVNSLPAENYNLLKFLVLFLGEVASHSEVNLMNASNLAIVFGPNLAWPGDQQITLRQLDELNEFAWRLIDNAVEIFNSPLDERK
ncbi:RhoGAP domain protein [Trichuris suis]|nr:RhoGAP domain protein [Trichuris suis]